VSSILAWTLQPISLTTTNFTYTRSLHRQQTRHRRHAGETSTQITQQHDQHGEQPHRDMGMPTYQSPKGPTRTTERGLEAKALARSGSPPAEEPGTAAHTSPT